MVNCEKDDGVTEQDCSQKLQAVGDALYVIGGKWKLRVIIALSNGSSRFNDLQRKIPGISARVLSNELKELEINGFLNRTVDPEATPVLVEYQLTKYSLTLTEVVESLIKWGKMHREKIKEDGKNE